MSTMTVASRARRTALLTILFAGGLGGLLDILYAIAVWGSRSDVGPMRILQSVASGLLGRDAFSGGMATALLGLAAHFSIAIGAAALFYVVSTRWRLLVDRPFFSGTVFGLGMYVVMNYVIVPLSASPGHPPKLGWPMLIALFPHIFFIGIPFALIVRRALRNPAA